MKKSLTFRLWGSGTIGVLGQAADKGSAIGLAILDDGVDGVHGGFHNQILAFFIFL